MSHPSTKSIRPFIGAKDYQESLRFYETVGFEIIPIGDNMSYLHYGTTGFYLQDAYVKDWVDNTMVFLEVKDAYGFLATLEAKRLPESFAGVRLSKMVENDWGREFFLHDPSGILWHIGTFIGAAK